VALTVERLPRFLVLEPISTVRFDLRLAGPANEIEVELENPGPGRSFVLMLGSPGGPMVRRLQLTGGARIVFGSPDLRSQVLMLANPQKEPLVLQLRGRSTSVGRPRASRTRAEPALRPPRETAARGEGKPRARPTASPPGPKGTEVIGLPVGAGLRRARPKG